MTERLLIGMIVLAIVGFLLFLFYILTVFILPVAPWARVKPPYFEVSMGEIYKEVAFYTPDFLGSKPGPLKVFS